MTFQRKLLPLIFFLSTIFLGAQTVGNISVAANSNNHTTEVCPGETLGTLTAGAISGFSGAVTHTWSVSTDGGQNYATPFSGPNSSASATYTQAIQASANGLTFKVTVSDGSSLVDSDPLTITTYTPATVTVQSNLPSPSPQGASHSLTVSGISGGLSWQDNASLTDNPRTVLPMTTTTYFAQGIDANSCSVVGSFQVIVNELFPGNLSSSSNVVCSGSVPPLIKGDGILGGAQASGGYTSDPYVYQWGTVDNGVFSAFNS